MIKEYKMQIFKTEEDHYSEAEELLDNVFHSEILYTERAWDLMYRNFTYRIEVFEKDNMFNPIKVFMFKDFNRKKYKETFGSAGQYGTKGLWRSKEEEELKTNKWNKK